MNLQDRLTRDMQEALRAKDAERLGTLRLLKSALGYAQLERNEDALLDSDFIAVVQKEVKKRRDAAEQYRSAGRAELAEREERECAVLESYLPQRFTPEELESLVREVIQETGATSKRQMGTVIKAVQAKAAGRADGKTISEYVGRLLG